MHEAPPPSRVPTLLADHPPADAKKTRSSPRPRQLRHPQAFQREDMAGQAPPLSHAFHPHFGLLAQSGRALLRPDHSGAHPSRRLHFGCRARSCHSRLPGTPQCRPQAFRLDQISPRNPGKSHSCPKRAPADYFRESNVRSITLVRLHRHRAPISDTQPTDLLVTVIRVTPSRAMDTLATGDIPPIPVLRAMGIQATRRSPVTPDPRPMDTRADRCTLPIPVPVMDIPWLATPAIALRGIGRLGPSTLSSLLAEFRPRIHPNLRPCSLCVYRRSLIATL